MSTGPILDVHGIRAAALRARADFLHQLAVSPRPDGRLPRRVNLALQGGGAHGAFTWGALDRLLEEQDFGFEGISGTSAGALNAAVLASGWLQGGAAGARQALNDLWTQVAELTRLSPLQGGKLPQIALDLTAHLLSPYQLNPLGVNPLRTVLARLIDFERLREARHLQVLIAATDVEQGAVRLFTNAELSLDVVLASACLPQVFKAVEVQGRRYWDGGYVSNPPLVPLVETCATRDTVLIQINPSMRPGLPTGSLDIRDRIGEIAFGQPLSGERAVLVERRRLARHAPLTMLDRRLRRCARHRLHVIDGSEVLSRFEPITKVVVDANIMNRLRETGRAAAQAWLQGQPAPATSPGVEAPLRQRPAA